MTHVTSTDFAAALRSFNTEVKANNQKKVQKLVAMLHDAKVCAMLNAQNIAAHDLNVALYTSEKAISFCYDVTRDHVSADFEANVTACFKSLLNARKIDETFTRADAYDCIMNDSKSARAHVYQRKHRIASKAQVDYSFAALQMLKVIDRATNKAIECDLITLAETQLAQVIV